ncbi:hypothetical protein [Streptomyces phytophilus]|uniref:hypothetical protein n=1 Tax=Streptomyces phytophilus TaxID=722715 RepID=UPI0015F028A0|nr:hypothetical protein [Streptomyces phytophilus]
MRPIKTAVAIARFKVADARLAANTRREEAAGVMEETGEFSRRNRAVADAEDDPHLPDRYRDPRDRQG